MAAHKGSQPCGGSRKGKPNRITKELKDMILEALDKVGGAEYLQRQAEKNPAPFLTLVGKVLPLQVTGKDGDPLVIKLVRFSEIDAGSPDS
jgi:hypothetical protein